MVIRSHECGAFVPSLFNIRGRLNDNGLPRALASFCLSLSVAVPDGYHFMHNGKILTVFSASRYCGRGTNRGAFVIFEPDLAHTVQMFVAGPLSETEPSLLPPPLDDLHSVSHHYKFVTALSGGMIAPLRRVGSSRSADGTPVREDVSDAADEAAQQEAVRRMLMERICLHKDSLYFYWSSIDRGSTNAAAAAAAGTKGNTHAAAAGVGHLAASISKLQWAEGMRQVLNLDLPWLALIPMLVDIEPDGSIVYPRFLDRYHIAMRASDSAWMDSIVDRVSEQLFAAADSLEAAFAKLDTDGSGVVELRELEAGLSKLDLGLSRAQVVDVMTSLDEDRDGRVSFAEFRSRFQEGFTRRRSLQAAAGDGAAGANATTTHRTPPDAWTAALIGRIGAAFVSAGYGDNTAAIFTRIDTDLDGLLSMTEFTTAVRSLGLALTEADIARARVAVDSNGSGYINYLEFTESFRGVPQITAPASWQPAITDAAAAQLVAAVAAHGATAARPLGDDSEVSPPHLVSPSGDSTPLRGWQRGLIERIVSTLFEFRVELAAAFRMFDLDGGECQCTCMSWYGLQPCYVCLLMSWSNGG